MGGKRLDVTKFSVAQLEQNSHRCEWLPAQSKTNPAIGWLTVGTHQACCKESWRLRALKVTSAFSSKHKNVSLFLVS